jgi:hypothetical protein
MIANAGQEQTSAQPRPKSALPLKADIAVTGTYVGFGP